MVKLAILIPTLNGGKLWEDLLISIDKQSVVFDKKIIVDSGSADNTVSLAITHGFDVVSITKDQFNHGATRQLLVDLANADISILLTQDAVLTSSNSVENLIAAFEDPAVGMAYGRQLPHENANILERHGRSFNYPETSSVRSIAHKGKLGFKVFFCSNAFAAYRTAALKSIGGFQSDSIMGEDAIACAGMLLHGFKVAYMANATVNHSHNYSFMDEFKRYFDTRVFHQQNTWLIKEFGKPTGEGWKFLRSQLGYVYKHDFKSFFKAMISIAAKWLGYQSGRFYRQLPISIVKRLSMHPAYWKKHV